MNEEQPHTTGISLIRMDEGRWRVFIDGADMGTSFQFPWDALQCAFNGSLTGKPLNNLQTIEIQATNTTDHHRLARIRAAQAEQRALLAALRGIDGDGI
ncbi:MAG TPA: hypothetical protein VF735_13130 [Pyrinomonadaceae bacterium]|jgi:hypothetical protein